MIDVETKAFFNGHIKQIFVYLTNRCQLRCEQCLYKPLLNNASDDIPFETLRYILTAFKDLGAFKLSFLGGEPTLYCDLKNSRKFSDVVELSKSIGYSYVRVDTNGQFDSSFIDDEKCRLLDEITFSLDGYDAKTNDVVRGEGAFNNCISNIRAAVNIGYKVQLTSCIHRALCSDFTSGLDSMYKLIELADRLGVDSINFHPILKAGVARDSWISDTEIDPYLWKELYSEISGEIDNREYKVNVRLPMRYVETQRTRNNKEYGYCPLKMGERALVMPNGQIKVCAFMIGTSHCVANYNSGNVTFEQNLNELDLLNHNSKNCCNQSNPAGLTALCMSYKPNQKEIVWETII
jgi:MoaA/NifB/PqqE/SkfB family radical SAM enzyme